MPDFIKLFMDLTAPMESPTNFFYWSAISCVGSLIRDNIWIPFGPGKLHANTYILLLADPAGNRKSVPLRVVNDIMKEVRNTKIIAGRTTIAGILEVLSNPWTDKDTGKQVMGGSCILLAEELAGFFVQDPEFVPRITDLYDSRDEWDDNLRGGSARIKGLCLSMLAASNEEFLKDVYNKSAVFGGLLRRTFFIKPGARKPPNSLFGKEQKRYDKTQLYSIARTIASIKGPATQTQEATDSYETWYKCLYGSYGKSGDRSGIIESLHTNVLKLGLIIAVARRQSIEITWTDLSEAMDKCYEIIPNYSAYSMSVGSSDNAKIGGYFLPEIWEAEGHRISRRLFLRKYFHEMDVVALDSFILTIMQAGIITEEIDSPSMELFYKLTEAGIERFRSKLESTKDTS